MAIKNSRKLVLPHDNGFTEAMESKLISPNKTINKYVLLFVFRTQVEILSRYAQFFSRQVDISKYSRAFGDDGSKSQTALPNIVFLFEVFS